MATRGILARLCIRLLACASAGLAMMLFGCASSQIQISVQSIGDPGVDLVSPRTFRLVEVTTEDQLMERNLGQLAVDHLISLGWVVDEANPSVDVVISAKLYAREKVLPGRTFSYPVYDPGQSASFSGNVQGSGGWANYSGQVSTDGSWRSATGYVGPRAVGYNSRVFMVWLIDRPQSIADGKLKIIWQGTCISDGSSSNLLDIGRHAVPEIMGEFPVPSKKPETRVITGSHQS